MTASPRQAPDDLAEPAMPYWGFCVDGPHCGVFYTSRFSIFPLLNVKAKQIVGVYAIEQGGRLWRWSGKAIDTPRQPPDAEPAS
jgi:hypothetical protein